MSELRVLFAPMLPENPYQQRLAEELATRGVVVAGLDAADAHGPGFLRRVQEFAPHVLHFHWVQYHFLARRLGRTLRRTAAFATRLARLRRQGIRVVWTAHNLTAHEGHHRWLDALVTRRVIRLADGVIAHCDAARREVIAFAGLAHPERVTVVPHPSYIGCYPDTMTREEARRMLGIAPDRFVYLSLGRVRAYKGLDELLGCFAGDAPAPTALLLIAGRAQSAAATEEFRRQTEGVPAVRFDPGFVPADRIQAYLRAADVVVLPYRDILTSGSAVLAMSFGVPVIGPRIACLGEWLRDQDTLLYDPDDPSGLAAALGRAWRGRAHLPATGAHNRALAEAWPCSRCAEETLAVYRRAVSSAPA